MDPRQAYKTFIRFMLSEMVAEGRLDLTQYDVDHFVESAEDDITFYEKLEDFLKEYIEDFGENYGIN